MKGVHYENGEPITGIPLRRIIRCGLLWAVAVGAAWFVVMEVSV